jgi:hypothetical protein
LGGSYAHHQLTQSPAQAGLHFFGSARSLERPRDKPLLLLAVLDAVSLDRDLDRGLGISRIDPSNLDGWELKFV